MLKDGGRGKVGRGFGIGGLVFDGSGISRPYNDGKLLSERII